MSELPIISFYFCFVCLLKKNVPIMFCYKKSPLCRNVQFTYIVEFPGVIENCLIHIFS